MKITAHFFSLKRLYILPLFISVLLTGPLVFAQSTSDLDQQLQQKQQEIVQVQAQLDGAQKQESTLKNQLTIIDSQSKLTQLKIDETNFKIAKLNSEIIDLNGRLDRISGTLDSLSQSLLILIVKTYKYTNTSPLELIFSSSSVGDLLTRVKYINTVQAQQKQYLYQLQATKDLYHTQKQDKENRQAQDNKLKADLTKYQQDLVDQKKAKEDLLRVTQNNEANFQSLLVRLRADTESISRALGVQAAVVGPVSKGQRIASVGNSGCSTGPHLHFEVITPAHVDNGRIVNENGQPLTWSMDHRVDPKPYLDSGKFAKVVGEYTGNDCSQSSSCNNGDVSTRFGQVYFLGTHTGLDIADYYGAGIYAADSGTAYATQDSAACSITGTVGKGVFIDHGNGIVTLYWHIP